MDEFQLGVEGLREVRNYSVQMSALCTGAMLWCFRMLERSQSELHWRAWYTGLLMAFFVCTCHFFIATFNASHLLAGALLRASENFSAAAAIDFWGEFDQITSFFGSGSEFGVSALMKIPFVLFLLMGFSSVLFVWTKSDGK